MNLALFDFDKTITTQDSFSLFLRYTLKKKRASRFKVLYLFLVLVAMIFKVITEQKAKEAMLAYLFKGWTKTQFDSFAMQYAQTVLPGIMLPIALKRIDFHKSQGDKIVVVTASLAAWINVWCDKHEVDAICSDLETNKGLITGKLTEQDCIGIEKVNRVRAKYNLQDYNRIFAYGDSYRDKEMLDLADIAYYKWKEVKNKSTS